MKLVVRCVHCGHTRNPQELAYENRQGPDGIGVPPKDGDYWLCGVCGYIHVFDQGGDGLVTRGATGEEILEALLCLPEMIEERNRILTVRLMVQKGLPS